MDSGEKEDFRVAKKRPKPDSPNERELELDATESLPIDEDRVSMLHELLCETPSSTSEWTDEVENLCTFRCFLCSFAVNKWREMLKHMRIHPKANGVKWKERVDFKEQCLQNRVMHKCGICRILVLCDRKVIGDHLQSHGITLTDYRRRLNEQT